MSSSNANAHYLPVREDWLARRTEEPLDPALPIVDPHHHLWDRPGWRYLLDDLLADTNSGHNIVATVFVQCRAMHRAGGPEELRPVGETEFVNGVAAMSASGGYGPTRGLRRHRRPRRPAAGRARAASAGGAYPRRRRALPRHPPHHRLGRRSGTAEPGLRAAAGTAGRRRRSARASPRWRRWACRFDAWLYHPQIDELTALARAFPDTPIVLNHVGGPLGIGAYAGKRDEVFADWSAGDPRSSRPARTCTSSSAASACAINGFGFDEQPTRRRSERWPPPGGPISRPASRRSARARCMFESNFPVDKGSYSYARVLERLQEDRRRRLGRERSALFSGTASRFYKLGG